jgi:hypothetical protein
MQEVRISNDTRWQVQHWRTLVSVYRRSPFWEYYEHSLQPLFETQFGHLYLFNIATHNWIANQLKLELQTTETLNYRATYDEVLADLRPLKPATNKSAQRRFPHYYQIFEDRIGFQPDLSILDLLFAEGPNTLGWIKTHTHQLVDTF